ncbi:pyruvate dehydrogenase (acetyl-transferring) E1 component subunit alpha [Rhodococcus qingshengii]|uniref:pyruvate dehydrogenase (acetyl-transferring) E1 component subunit alpha n=1 Tax=Rhodococcus qingshengii TaxID=334542 RepID=UPI0010A5D95E|nr:pyruvate dehydrogenase (acetyl-transferring) E1 component subunit alpha [Rhodococcus qingshengii]THJ64945.1 pyruvate dehydrogenase (acetyl-transferring) E1 component subunit alpha [Rhodococcus qingshengii]
MSDNEGLVQLITPAGERLEHPEYSALVSDIDIGVLGRLYEDLVVVRRIDTEATALQRQGELGLWAPLLGQEAAQVGSARALDPQDFVFASYREHAVAYCRGVDPTQMLRFWRGSTHSGWNPYEYRMTTPAIIVGAQALHATGYALGMQFDGVDGAAITYFGDGATSQGDISEALGFAASFHAPVVFFCQNNQWAISEPVSLQTRVNIAERGRGFGVPSVRVDGNDILAVIAVTRAALARAREGSGPTLIEAVTYRMGPHTTSDDPTRYRPAALDDEWRAKDPLDRVRLLLEKEGALDEEAYAAIGTQADATAAKLRRGCLETAEPTPLSMFDEVYAEPHPLIAEERREFASYLQGFEGDV